jgi:protein-tyrosine-phosphatase
MKVIVVCTGNVARSPALACLLQAGRQDMEVGSAAVGHRAVSGLRMRKPMRDIMAWYGYATYADLHRSRLLADCDRPDLIIAVAPVHMKRLEEIAPGIPRLLCDPVIPDPAFGNRTAYEHAWDCIVDAAGTLMCELPDAAGMSCE